MSEHKISKKEAYKKVQFYAKEITKQKPSFDTVFRIYYDSLQLIEKILYSIEENPWHPDQWDSNEIFLTMKESFDKLEEIRIKANE